MKIYFKVILVFFVFVYSFLINIQQPLYYQLIVTNVTDANSTVIATVKSCVLPPDVAVRQSWIYLVNLLLVNVVINNVLNVQLVIAVFNSRRRVSINASSSSRNMSIRDRKFAFNSIALNLTCMVFKFPLAMTLLLSNYLNLSGDQIGLLFTASVAFYTMDNGAAFFINFFMNSIFYDEFLSAFGIKRIFGMTSLSKSMSRSRSLSNHA